MPLITLYREADRLAETVHQQEVLPGELRTGKEPFARALHRMGARVVPPPLDKSTPQRKQFINH